MPSMAFLSAQELLIADDNEIVQYLNSNRIDGGGFDISQLTGVDGLSKGQREEFSRKLRTAAEKAGTLDINALITRLAEVNDHDETNPAHPQSQCEITRSATSSPCPDSNEEFQAFCYHELVKAGGRPVVSIEYLSRASRDADADLEKIEPWLSDTNSGSQNNERLGVFSTQLEDWTSFQQKWQWDNRGRIAGKEAFSAFFELQKSQFSRIGKPGMVSDPSFEATVRRQWEHEPRFLEVSHNKGFAAYRQAVKKRLISHNFTRPFQLSKDPRQQDEWTTWVEYLNFVYWWLDQYTTSMKTSEAQYRKACKELQSFDASTSSSMTTGTLHQQLDATRAELEATRQKIRKFLRDTGAYRRAETAVRRQALRAQWVLQQVLLIERGVSQPCETVTDNSTIVTSKKRRRQTDQETQTQYQTKRQRWEDSNSGPTELNPIKRKRSENTMTASGSAATSIVTRRSERLITRHAAP